LKKFKSTDYPKETAIAELFLHLAIVDWQFALRKMNDSVKVPNNNNNNNGQKKR